MGMGKCRLGLGDGGLGWEQIGVIHRKEYLGRRKGCQNQRHTAAIVNALLDLVDALEVAEREVTRALQNGVGAHVT